MRQLLLLLVLSLCLWPLASDSGIAIKKGGQIGQKPMLLVWDLLHWDMGATGYCDDFRSDPAGTAIQDPAGANAIHTRAYVGRQVTLTLIDFVLKQTGGNTNGACNIDIYVDGVAQNAAGQVASPAYIGDGSGASTAGRTGIFSAGDSWSSGLNIPVSAGSYISMCYNTTADGCTGNPGVCTCNATNVSGDLEWRLYGVEG